ncbi:amino acid adenylation domain-containing protein [Paenibacillus sp. FSL R7-0652]|uniref:type I polyketide synthase n=1 Tax=Paenibacillus sp. FSL R7-0652 TaxID=2921687 RepID=UPI00315AB99A
MESSQYNGLEVAIIGMSGRFPGASDLKQFWHNLKNGVESLTRFTDEQLKRDGVPDDLLRHPSYVNAKGLLTDYDHFDASFFNYVPTDAELLDPQIRLFHECAWEALEEGGYAHSDADRSIGVYAGASSNLLWEATASLAESAPESKLFADSQLTDKDFISTRVSYALNLKGPSLTVYTACSTSLVTIHMACQALLSGECRMALAGGVTISLPQEGGYLYQEGMILSPDGYCRAFDQDASGTVGGSGAGVVLLKRLEDALEDGDPIHAVIKGSAINNDGSAKSAFSAPSIEEQSRVIRTAMLAGEVDACSISYVEAHGTGTYIGDPVELEGLRLAFEGAMPASCGIGSVKSNIGHLDCAAGVAGLIKTVLALKYKTLPPTLHVTNPNPQFDWKGSPFYVNTKTRPWKSSNGSPLRAGISSFGIGGTNAHLILEEAPKDLEQDDLNTTDASQLSISGYEQSSFFFPLSAKTPEALHQTSYRLARFLQEHPYIDLKDIAYTLVHAREAWMHRAGIICSSRLEALELLHELASGELKASTDQAANHIWGEVRDNWLSGASIKRDYGYLFTGKTLHIPTYPFQRTQFNRQLEVYKELTRNGTGLVDKSGSHSDGLVPSVVKQEIQKSSDLSTWIYIPSWSRTFKLADVLDKETEENLKENLWIVMPDSYGIAKHLTALLEEHKAEVLYVDHDLDLKIIENNNKPLKVIYLQAVHQQEADLTQKQFKSLQKQGSYRFLGYIRKLIEYAGDLELDIISVTNGVQLVTGAESINPGQSPIHGLSLVVQQEHPNVTCTVIDFEETVPSEDTALYACSVLQEAVRSKHHFEPFIAFRYRYRWIAQYVPASLPVKNKETYGAWKDKVWCITGGFGGIGRAMAEHFSIRHGVRIVLIGRTAIPDPSTWDRTEEDELSVRTTSLIRWARGLEERGGQIMLVTADAAKETDLTAAFHQVQLRWGDIHGVIHAAGLTGGTTFELTSSLNETQLEEQFHAKVYGTIELKRVLEKHNPDFCVMFSSLSAVLGGISYGAYAAGNRFLDAYVNSVSHHGDSRWISIGWDGWNISSEVNVDQSNDAYLMEPHEGIEVLERILQSTETGHLIVATADLIQRRKRWVTALKPVKNGASSKRSIRKLPRPLLSDSYCEPENKFQRQLVSLWEDFFGIEPIGIDDDFFELGGDSLKGATLITAMQKEHGIRLPLSELFENSTIRGLDRVLTHIIVPKQGELIHGKQETTYPLSPAQTRMYFMSQFHDKDTNYNIPSAVIVEGTLNKTQVELALRRLVERHPMLRSSFHMEGTEPVQKVHHVDEVSIILDYREAEFELSTANLHEFIQPFDLQLPSQFRASLIRFDADRHLLFMDMHHIISDGVSTGILIREFIQLYDGKILPLPTHQYNDYVHYVRSISSEEMKQKEQYWLNQYQGELPTLNLPLQPEQGWIRNDEGGKFQFMLDRDIVQKLNAMSLQYRGTPFMTLLAIYYVFLSKYCNQEDIVIGTASAGRQYEHADDIVGMFVNTLPLRNYPTGDKRFFDFLNDIKSNVLQSFDHQEYPFELLVQKLDLTRDLEKQPLIETMFVYQNIDLHVKANSLTFTGLDVPNTTSKYDLMLEAKELNGEIICLFHYRAQRFSAAYMEQMSNHFMHLIDQCLTEPEKKLQHMRLMKPQEERLLLEFTHPLQCESVDKELIESRFEAIAEQYPERLALLNGEECVSYDSLNKQANRLAHTLISKLPENKESIVVILLGRSNRWLVPSVLGTVKAGAAYLLIEPDLPQERIAYMIKDSGAVLVITVPEHEDRLVEIDTEQLMLQAETLSQRTDNLQFESSPDRLAYVMYTSGTTGTPKAVMIENRNIVRMAMKENYRLFIRGERVLQTASIMFDAFTLELWGTLANGGALIVLHERVIQDVHLFGEAVLKYQISDLFLTTSLFNYLVQQQPSAFAPLQTVVIGGEAASAYHADLLYQACPNTILINGYGPTENTTFSTYYQVEPGHTGTVPIGVPFFRSQAYVVDPKQIDQLQPLGVEGELCVAGEGMGRGYLNRPDLTDLKFVLNPYAPGQLMYRTGDYAKWQPDGTLQFIGRIDDQVKVRGYRVELEEIHACLLEHPYITGAAVIPVEKEGERGKEISAYFTSEIKGLEREEVRKFIGARLPRYMVPTFITQLDSLPLTPNGKLNKRALPDPWSDVLESDSYLLGPSSDMERRLAPIFEEVLEIDAAGRNSNFFDLGGHSLKAMQLVSRIRSEWGIELTLKDVFRHPVMAELASILEDKVLSDKEQGEVKLDKIIPLSKQTADFPLSSAQQRLFILEQFQDIGTSYNMPFVFQLEGKLDEDRVQNVYKAMFTRHPMLRASFHMTADGRPVQNIVPIENINTEIERCTCALSDEKKLREIIGRFIRPFVLESPPLVRAGIVQLLPDLHLLLLDMHHLISDGVSMNIWAREFMRLYDGTNLTETQMIRLQYTDYAVWQQQQLHSGAFDSHKKYWLEQLGGTLPVLDLPTDYSRPILRDYAGSQLRFALGPVLTDKMRAFSKEHGITLYMLTLAAYGLLLHRYSGQDDLIIGTPVAGRTHEEMLEVIGMFVNTLAIRSRLHGKLTVSEYLEEIEKTALQAYEHAAYPFEELVNALNVTRDTSRNPIFDTMFSLQNISSNTIRIPGLDCKPYDFDSGQSGFDLSFQLYEQEEDLDVFVEYSTRLFKESTIQLLGEHFTSLLEWIILHPSAELANADMLTNEKKQTILKEFNPQVYEIENLSFTLSHLVEAQAKISPESAAVQSENELLTYGELIERSGLLSSYLKDLRVAKGDTVGILMSNSAAMIISLLAIQRIGAVCMPLDPDYPEKRIAYMLEDAEAALLITNEECDIPALWEGQTLILNHAPEVDKKSNHSRARYANLAKRVQAAGSIPPDCSKPDDIVYRLYTSGTTGQPKGVLLKQSHVVHYIRRFCESFSIVPGDRVLHHSSVSFDTSMEEIYPALVTGASVHIAGKAVARHVESLISFVAERAITVISASPVMLSELDRHLKEHQVRLFISGGDVLKKQHISRLMQKAEVYNSYGPTETTVCAAYHHCKEMDDEVIPIGKPIPGYRIYILNPFGQLQPPGIPGELFIAGAGVSLGYAGKETLTAEKFIPDPFEGGWMYRTGDLAKWDEMGTLHFIGRVDQQVKIRGYRVELQEIETALLQISGVREAVVLVRSDERHFQRLQAFLVTDQIVPGSNIREQLLQALPEYMIPHQFTQLDHVPLTQNGKVDRRKLEQEFALLENEALIEEPARTATETELQIMQMWQEVLESSELSIYDNFFEKGGHSLRATSLAVKIRHAFGLDFNIQHVFQYQTIAEMSSFLETNLDTAQLENISTAPLSDHYPISSAQKRMLLLSAAEGSSISYNMPLVMDVSGPLDANRCREAFEIMVRRHDILRTSFHFADGVPVQVIHNQTPVHWNELWISEEMIDPEIQKQIQPFRLDEPSQLKLCLFHIETDRAILLFDIHHIISDGVSIAIFIEEFMELYRGNSLPAVQLQYKDFATWQHKMLSGSQLDRQKEYWINQFDIGVPVLQLPYDYARPKLQSFEGRSLSFAVDSKLTEQLKELAFNTESTMYMVLLAAYYVLLYRYSGQRDIVIGCPIAGRQHEQLEDMLGMFVNTLPLRIQLEGDVSFNELLKNVRTRTLEAYSNQDYPFDELVDQLDYRRDLSRNPLFDTVLVMQNMKEPSSIISDLVFKPRDFERNSTMFDIRFEVTESADGLQCTMDYCTSLFKEETIRRFSSNYLHILKGFVHDPSLRLDEIELEHGYTVREQQDWLESISFDF